MKLSALIRKNRLWWWRVTKLSMLAIPMILVTALEFEKRETTRFIKMIIHLPNRFWIFIRLFGSQFLNKDFLSSKYGTVEKVP